MTLSLSLRRLLEPRTFEDPEEARAAWMIHWVLLGIIVVLLPMFPLTPFMTDRPGPVWLLHATILVSAAVALWLVRRGVLRPVCIGFTAVAWIIITIGAALFGGIRAPAVLSYPVVVVAAGYLVGRRAATVVAVLSAVAALGFLWGDSAGLLPDVVVTPGRLWMGVAGALAAVTLFVEIGISANEQRRRYAQQLRMTLEAARVGTWEFDVERGVMQWGEGTERVLGVDGPRVGATFTSYLSLVAEADREVVQEAWVLAQRGEAALAVDHRVVTDDGSTRWLAIRGRTTGAEHGKVARLVGTVMDVTAARMNEEVLRQGERRLAEAQRVASVGSWEWDAKTGSSVWSVQLYRVLGVETELRPSRERLVAVFHPDDRAHVEQLLERAERAGQAFEFEHRIQRTDGAERHVLGRGEAVTDADGLVVGLRGSIQDVTDRKRAERALRESEEKYRILFEHSPVGIGIADLEGRLLAFNAAMLEPGGYTSEDIKRVGSVAELYHDPADRDGVFHEIQERGAVRNREIRFKRKRGGFYHSLMSLQPVVFNGRPALLSIVQDISGRKRAEAAVRDREERLRQALGAADAGAWHWDMQSNAVTWSEENFRLLGFEPGAVEPSYERWLQSVHPDDRAHTQRAVEDAVAGKRELDTDYRVQWPDGTVRWARDMGRIRFDDDGKPVAMYGIQIDITERKAADLKLRESEERFRAIFDRAAVGIVQADRQGRFVQVNDTFCAMVGYTCDELVGRSFADITHPDDLAEDRANLEQLRRGKAQSFRMEKRYLRKDGTVVWGDLTVSGVHLESGEPHYWIGVIEDITERRQAQDSLRKSEEQLRMVLSQIDEVVYAVNVDPAQPMAGAVTFVSDRTKDILGYDSDDFLREPALWGQAIHPEDRDRVGESTMRVIQTGKGVTREYRLRHRDSGTYRWMEDRVVPQLDARGRVARLFGVARDVTARMETLAALRESESRFRRLFETMAQGVVYQDADGTIVDANPAAQRILGLTLAQMQGRTSTDPRWQAVREDGSPFPGESHPAMLALRTGKTVHDVTMGVYQPTSDRYHWITINAVPEFRMGQKEPYRVYTTFDDITARKEAEEALRASQGMLQLVLDAIPVRVFWKDRDSVYLGSNRLFAQDAGLREPDEILGKNDFELAWSAQAELYRADDRLVMETGTAKLNYQEPQTWPDGTSLWLRTSKVPLRDLSDAVIGVLGTYEDITEQRRAEAALQASQERLHKAFGLSPDAIAITRAADGQIVEINDAFTGLSGYSRDEAVGRTATELGFWGDPTERDTWLRELRKKGRMRRVGRQVRDRHGVVHDTELSMEFIELDGQSHVLWYATDVTERNRAEEAVRRSREQLRQLAARLQAVREEERTAIAREIHDELGQALTGVKMDLAWLIGRFPKHWKAVRARGEVLTALVDNTINVARDLSARLRPSVLDDLGLSAAVEWLTADFQRRVGSAIAVVAHVEEIEVNREGATALFRILQEALTNVIRHAQASQVIVKLETGDGGVLLEVHDNGQGIPSVNLDGTGSLGLIGMRERAAALEGMLEIESAEGKGTIVWARLPMSRVGRGAQTL